MRLLVTGSSGFLGQHLVHSLLTLPIENVSEDLHLFALVHSVSGLDAAIGAVPNKLPFVRTHVVSLDLTDEKAVEAWVQHNAPFDACIHAAALSSPRVCQTEPDRAARLNNPTHFFRCLQTTGNVKRILALSTDQVYEGTRAPYAETDDTRPCNVYGQTKVAMEESLGTLFGSRKEQSVVLLRSSIILGPRAPLLPEETHDTFLHFCASRKDTDTVFYTDECRSIVFVDNVVDCIRWLLATTWTERSCVYNLGGPTSVSRYDMAQAVFAQLHYDTRHLQAAAKAEQPPGLVPSPLDISMKVDKLYDVTKGAIEWRGLDEIVRVTLPDTPVER